MATNEGYYRTEVEFDSAKIDKYQSICENGDKIYTYEEAIDLAGTGLYSKMLLFVASFALLAMTIDLYGFAVVVTACSCDFQLDQERKSILLTMPFLGAMVMAYPWGYLSDTRGRRKCLVIAMAMSCVASIVSAFSVNWIMMGICKFISASFCTQSITYAWIGESTPARVRGAYMLFFTCAGLMYLIISYAPAYFILNLNFSYDLGAIYFTPWRLLAFILALPSGVSALSIKSLYESPKYVLKAGRDQEAMDILRSICERNGRTHYPVKKIILSEDGNVESKGLPLLESIRVQTVPLFKPPYLWRTLQLFFLILVVLGCTNSLYVWFPFVATAFYDGISASSEENPIQGLCNVIVMSEERKNEGKVQCTSIVDVKMIWISIIQGLVFLVVNLIISKFSLRRKLVMIVLLTIAGASGIGTMVISDPYNISSFILFFGILLNGLGVGIIYTYCVDIYPTSHRGMASSLVLLVGRISGLIAIYLIGANILTNCSATFYTISGLIFAACAMSCFLPPDQIKKTK